MEYELREDPVRRTFTIAATGERIVGWQIVNPLDHSFLLRNWDRVRTIVTEVHDLIAGVEAVGEPWWEGLRLVRSAVNSNRLRAVLPSPNDDAPQVSQEWVEAMVERIDRWVINAYARSVERLAIENDAAERNHARSKARRLKARHLKQQRGGE